MARLQAAACSQPEPHLEQRGHPVLRLGSSQLLQASQGAGSQALIWLLESVVLQQVPPF